MDITERIHEHLARLSIKENDSDTAWLLRECKREIERLRAWEPSLTTRSGGIDFKPLAKTNR